MTHPLPHPIGHKPQRPTAQIVAEVAVGDLSGRMLALAEAVSTEPHNFTRAHAAKLRDAAQVAVSAAELITRGHAK